MPFIAIDYLKKQMFMDPQKIRNLVMKGGGVKGIAYVGALEVLTEKNVLQNIENVAGTSAGAITACLVALRYNAKEINNIVFNLNFKSFEDGWNPLRLLSSYGLYKGNAFLKWIKKRIAAKGLKETATFRDFQKHNCRDLKVFATDLYTQNIQEFSVETTPDTIVAEAVRASMSIPLFFKSMQFSNGTPNDHLYVDGGVLFNFPIEIFDKGEGLEDGKTLGLYLSNLSGKPTVDPFGKWHLIHYIRSLFDTLLLAQDIEFKEDSIEKEFSIIINDLGISATDFGLTTAQKKALIAEGRKAAEKYFS